MEFSNNTILLNAIKLHEGEDRIPGGNFQHVFYLGRELNKIPELNIKFVVDKNSYPEFAKFAPAEKLFYVDFDSVSVIKADLAILKAISVVKPAIYHRPTGQIPFFPLKCHTVVGVADFNFKHLKFSFVKKQYKDASYYWSFKKAKKVACISKFTDGELQRFYPKFHHKSQVVHLGFNELPTPDFSITDKLPGRFILVFAHQEHKNAELCIKVFSKLKMEMPDLGMVIVGKNRYVEEVLKPLAHVDGVANAVFFVGKVSSAQICGLFRKASVLLFPSKYEGFGLPVLEAMHVGCPVVCSNACSLPEVGGDAALYGDTENAEQYYRHIKMLLFDPEFRTRKIEQGRRQSTKFSWSKSARETHSIYQEIMLGLGRKR